MTAGARSSDQKEERKQRRMTVRVYQTRAEHDAADRGFWTAIPPEERVLETWRLSEELWRLRGEFPDEPGLYRIVASVRRS